MKKRGTLDQFFKPTLAGPLQQDQVEQDSQDAPLPEQQSPPPLPPKKKARTAHQQLPLPSSQRWAASSCIPGEVAPAVSLDEIEPVSPRRLLCRLCTIWTRRNHASRVDMRV